MTGERRDAVESVAPDDACAPGLAPLDGARVRRVDVVGLTAQACDLRGSTVTLVLRALQGDARLEGRLAGDVERRIELRATRVGLGRVVPEVTGVRGLLHLERRARRGVLRERHVGLVALDREDGELLG